MRLKYRPAAIADIQCTAEYIEKVLKNRSAAQRLKAKILQGASLLKENPQMETPITSLRFIVIIDILPMDKSRGFLGYGMKDIMRTFLPTPFQAKAVSSALIGQIV